MIGKQPKNSIQYSHGDFDEEIERLLTSVERDYRTRVYIKPVYWIGGIVDTPEKYPGMAMLTVKEQKRQISLFLKRQGRIPRGKKRYNNENVWMLPEALEVQA